MRFRLLYAFGILTSVVVAATAGAADHLVPSQDPTISAAVADAANGDRIIVAAGIYREEVAIDKSVTLLGAQAGVDARSRSGPETVVAALLSPSPPRGGFVLQAANIIVDGFTFQDVAYGNGNTGGAGVFGSPSFGGYQIVNNVFTNNIFGLYFNCNSASTVRHNLFLDNNQPGPSSGSGLYSDQGMKFATIDENKFVNNGNGAIVIDTFLTRPQYNTISNNDADSGISLYNCGNILVSGNNVHDWAYSAIVVGGNVDNVSITNNTLKNNLRGVRVEDFVGQPNSAVDVHSNNFLANTLYAIYLGPNYSGGPLDARGNWFGSTGGPSGGNGVGGNVTYLPYLKAPAYTNNGQPVDLNGDYWGPKGGQALAFSYPLFLSVIEQSGGVFPQDGTYTPFSNGIKPPTYLQVNPTNLKTGIVFAGGGTWSINDEFDLGLFGGSGDASVKITNSGAGYAFAMISGIYMSSTSTDTTGATTFKVQLSFDSARKPTAIVQTLDGSAPGSFVLVVSSPNSLVNASDYAFFAGFQTGAPSRAAVNLSSWSFDSSQAARLWVFSDDAYVQTSDTIFYRSGMAHVNAPVYGYQAFLQSNGSQSFSGGSYTNSPFLSHFINPITSALDLAGDVGLGGPPTSLDSAELAQFYLTPVGTSGSGTVSFEQSHVPPSGFGDGSLSGITANTFDSNKVIIDNDPPVASAFSVTQGGGPELIGSGFAVQGTINVKANVVDAGATYSGVAALPKIYLVKPDTTAVLLTSYSGDGNDVTASYTFTGADPSGLYKVRVVAIDRAGNSSTTDSASFTLNTSKIVVSIVLGGTTRPAPFTRGVVLVVGGTGGPNTPITVSKDVVFDTAGNGTAILDANDGIPAGAALTRISVKDRKHTLRKQDMLVNSGNDQYTATLAPKSGDANDDNVIDIIDYGIFASKYGQNLGANTPGTAPPTTATVHPDFSGNGIVGTEDYSYIQTQFLAVGDNEPGNYRPRPIPKAKATVKEMLLAGVTEAATMDLNRDGWITYQEITDWLGGKRG